MAEVQCFETQKAGVDERERRFHFRVDTGKTNLTRPPDASDWFKLVSVDLKNPSPGEDWDMGDNVGVVTRSDYPPLALLKVTEQDRDRALSGIEAGGPWRQNQQSQSEQSVGILIAEVLALDLTVKANKTTVAKLVKDWTEALLKVVTRPDGHREPRRYVESPRRRCNPAQSLATSTAK